MKKRNRQNVSEPQLEVNIHVYEFETIKEEITILEIEIQACKKKKTSSDYYDLDFLEPLETTEEEELESLVDSLSFEPKIEHFRPYIL